MKGIVFTWADISRFTNNISDQHIRRKEDENHFKLDVHQIWYIITYIYYGFDTRLFLPLNMVLKWFTGIGAIIPTYPLSPSTLLHDILCQNVTKFAFIINKLIISNFALCNQILKSTHKYAFYGEMRCLAIMGRRR